MKVVTVKETCHLARRFTISATSRVYFRTVYNPIWGLRKGPVWIRIFGHGSFLQSRLLLVEILATCHTIRNVPLENRSLLFERDLLISVWGNSSILDGCWSAGIIVKGNLYSRNITRFTVHYENSIDRKSFNLHGLMPRAEEYWTASSHNLVHSFYKDRPLC